jgi:hypothetical protein
MSEPHFFMLLLRNTLQGTPSDNSLDNFGDAELPFGQVLSAHWIVPFSFDQI